MTKKITIAIDAMGGENSPDKTIHGVKLFLDKYKKNNDFLIKLFGDEEKINLKLKKYNISNIQGSNSVASMVCFIDGKPRKKEYRKYKKIF